MAGGDGAGDAQPVRLAHRGDGARRAGARAGERLTTATVAEYRIGSLAQIPRGEGRAFEVGEWRIAIFHARDGAVYATQARCPHRGGPLADGLMGGSTLICPLHGWKFDLTTGGPLVGDCGVATYPVRLTATGDIMLTLDAAGA